MNNYKFITDQLRNEMLQYQIKSRGISDPRVLNTFKTVERHLFIPEHSIETAYSDHALPLNDGQTISQPYMVALMIENLLPDNYTLPKKVLEIGTGSGYQTAILAELFEQVISIEIIPELKIRAEKILNQLGYKNIVFIAGDGSKGYPDLAPYQGIIVSAGAPDIPEVLLEQLDEGGKLVIPVGNVQIQQLNIIEKQKDNYIKTKKGGCVFVPLKGEYGWKK